MTTRKALKILVAEDEETNSALVVRLLGKMGHEVTIANDGAAALDFVEKSTFDVLLLDWLLPKVDGIEISRKAVNATPRPSVIMMSSLDLPLARAHAMSAGAGAFLPKPLIPSALIKLIQELESVPEQKAAKEERTNHSVEKMEFWSRMPVLSAEMVAELTQLKAEGSILEGHEPTIHETGAECSLVDPARGLQMRVGVFGTRPNAQRVASKMLDEPTPADDDVASVVSELANVIGGAIKTSSKNDGYNFTMGLPVPSDSAKATAAAAPYLAFRRIQIAIEGAVLVVQVAIKTNGSIRVKVEELREGHVLGEDVLNATGALLVPACTRVTSGLAQRLRQSYPGRLFTICDTKS